MMQSQLVRYLHRSCPLWSAVSKSHLAKLRKKTGYTFSNCKKALEINDNDLTKAETWLQEQAQALGWSKLSKLEGRATRQGLVGIAFEGRQAAMVEVNCETDFVARNKHFKEMVNLASVACLQYTKNSNNPSNDISKVALEIEKLKRIEGSEGKTLADHVALLVSTVGENVSLKRGLCLSVSNNLNLACYVHPQIENNNTLNGKYGAIVVYSAPKYNNKTEEIARQLCQHIVGMNPKTIYKENNAEETVTTNKKVEEAVITNEDSVDVDPEQNEEDAMMVQDFLLDPSLTVEEMLAGSDIKVVDFVRFETGERLQVEPVNSEPLAKQKATQLGG